MSSNETYKERFESLFLMETKAKIVYETIHKNIADPFLKERLAILMADEARHAEVVKSFLAILNKSENL